MRRRTELLAEESLNQVSQGLRDVVIIAGPYLMYYLFFVLSEYEKRKKYFSSFVKYRI